MKSFQLVNNMSGDLNTSLSVTRSTVNGMVLRRPVETLVGDMNKATENETPLLSYSIYFYGRTTYIIIIAEPHTKPVYIRSAETGLQPCV